MILRFETLSALKEYLCSHLYLNKTTDPTDTKYYYRGMIDQLKYYNHYTLNLNTFTVLAYSNKHYNKIDMVSVFPGNANISFDKSRSQISLGDLLKIDKDVQDVYVI